MLQKKIVVNLSVLVLKFLVILVILYGNISVTILCIAFILYTHLLETLSTHFCEQKHFLDVNLSV